MDPMDPTSPDSPTPPTNPRPGPSRDKLPVDRRTIHATRTPEEVKSLREGRDAWFDREVALARTLAAIDAKAGYAFESCASVPELASIIGYDGFRAADLLDLGRALAASPEIEAKLRANRVAFAAGCALGKILPYPQYLRPDDQWLAWAETSTVRALKRLIRLRITKQKNQGKELHAYEALVDEETLLILERCQQVAPKGGKALSRGETLHEIGRHFLEDFDPLERALGTRRTGPTSETPFGKYVPVAVVVAIYRRAGGLCEVGGCMRPIDQLCHIKPRARGSGREERDLFGGCNLHHKIFDARLLTFLTWTEEGRPVFADRQMRPRFPVPRERAEPDEAFLARFVEPPAAATGAGATPAAEPNQSPATAESGTAAPSVVGPPQPPGQPDRVSEGLPPRVPFEEGRWWERDRASIRTGEGAVNDPAPPRVRLPEGAGMARRGGPGPGAGARARRAARRTKAGKPARHARPPPHARSP